MSYLRRCAVHARRRPPLPRARQLRHTASRAIRWVRICDQDSGNGTTVVGSADRDAGQFLCCCCASRDAQHRRCGAHRGSDPRGLAVNNRNDDSQCGVRSLAGVLVIAHGDPQVPRPLRWHHCGACGAQRSHGVRVLGRVDDECGGNSQVGGQSSQLRAERESFSVGRQREHRERGTAVKRRV